MPTGSPALVVVPGLGLGPEVYADLAAALLPLEVRCLPLPGYGRPLPAGPAPGPGQLAAGLLGELARLRDREVVLLGHSSSCQVVAEAAAAPPAAGQPAAPAAAAPPAAPLVRALVLVGPTTDPSAASWPRLAGRWLATAARERPGQVPLLVRVYARTGLGSMARAMDVSRRHDVRGPVSRVEVPVLVVRGWHDRIAPSGWTAAVAGSTGRGQVATLPAGAHMAPVTHPRLLAAALRTWWDAQLRP